VNQNDLLIAMPGQELARLAVADHAAAETNTARELNTGGSLGPQENPDLAEEALLLETLSQQEERYRRLEDVFSKYHFLRHLQREKLRSDRSKAPLSIAIFTYTGKEGETTKSVNQLLDLLHQRKRETDIIGYLAADVLALMLTETTEEGAAAFVKKIGEAGGQLFTTVTRTYPDQLFDRLIADNESFLALYPFFLDQKAGPDDSGYFLKRPLDLLSALAAIVVLSPILLLTALAIGLTSRGPIIYRQIRIGRRGAPFVFYKFRSMHANNDDRIHREYVARLIEGDLKEVNQGDVIKPVYKMKADPRITMVGRFIRKTSIDELPQLLNVLKGDMSMVGPRPPVVYEVERYQSWHLRRVLEVKPGITGLWQVEGRSRTTFDEMVRMDLRYMRDCSLWLDLKILLKTVKVVLRCDGAN
jgi:lipopolysaccharide/colanic/teichoic acid biosynthesis glycosyltransferase